jgi:hypothetical protein
MNDSKQSQENNEDLEPTDETAKQITGGDTAGTTPLSSVLKATYDTSKSITNNIR